MLTACGPPVEIADVNHDGRVDILDISFVSSCYTHDPTSDCFCAPADLDNDGDVDLDDLAIVQAEFGARDLPIPVEDVTAPEINIQTPQPGAYALGDRVVVRGEISERAFVVWVAGVRAELDAPGATFFEAEVPIEVGANPIFVEATDRACNLGRASTLVVVDASFDPDTNDDGQVNIYDVSFVSSCRGSDLSSSCACRPADIDGDGEVDALDADLVQQAFGSGGYPILPIDETPPTIELTSPVADAVVNTSPFEVTGRVDEAVGFERGCDRGEGAIGRAGGTGRSWESGHQEREDQRPQATFESTHRSAPFGFPLRCLGPRAGLP